MDPRYWGRSFWLAIFILITKFKHDIEACKRHVYILCSNLPCTECSTHAISAIHANNIMSTDDINIIYFFFISLYNNLVGHPSRLIAIDKVKKL